MILNHVDDTVITADQVNKYKDNKGLNFVLTTGTFFVK